MKLIRGLGALIRGYGGNQAANIAPLIAIMFTGLVGMAGYAIDMGHVMWVQRQLQTAADAAALAGALEVGYNSTTGQTLAVNYSGTSGKYNAVAGATSVTTTATPVCFASAAVEPTCAETTSGDNGLIVTETATVQTYFLKIFGLNSFSATATAKASAKGGTGTSLNVMVVLDTTASMNDADTNCTGGTTKIACAKAGAAALLLGLNTSTSRVGFMTYPPVNSTGVTNDTTCNGGTLGGGGRTAGSVEPYKNVNVTTSPAKYTPSSSATYTLSDFGASNAALATIAVGTNSGCTGQGIQAVGGVGTYFADALIAAQYALKNSSAASANAQNVIIVLSDGDASASSGNLGTGKYASQCKQAVTNAQSAASAGTWVYSVAYGSNSNNANPPNPTTTTSSTTSGTGNNKTTTTTQVTTTPTAGCSSDTATPISPCQTMAGMASDSTKFYSDGDGVTGTVTTTVTTTNSQGRQTGQTTNTANQTSACTGTGGNSTDLVELFKEISASLTLPRLVPNTTT